jgi:predicted protein tyrosine phosphatase
MAIQAIDFVSRNTAESLHFTAEMAVISITDPGKRVAQLDAWFSKVLRQSFFDAIPGDEFIPVPIPGCFDHRMAQEILAFIDDLRLDSIAYHLIVHCEQGLSRSAAIALFTAAYTHCPLPRPERAHRANSWVLDQLVALVPRLEVDIPLANGMDIDDDASEYCPAM